MDNHGQRAMTPVQRKLQAMADDSPQVTHLRSFQLKASHKAQATPKSPVIQRVVQRAAPGGIQHATNSCFVAAILNTFTVVRPLRNLLIPANNAVGGSVSALQDLLWKAVNTIDHAANQVPAGWVRQIMLSLVTNGILPNAVDTADVSNVMARIVDLLAPGNGQAGQANNMPVSSGEIAWFPNQTLQDAAYERIQQMQNQANDFTLTPNSVQVTRGHGNARQAPQTFSVYPADNSVVTYRLRSIIERSGKYVGGHFISHVDRGDGGQEWWTSDDLHPGNVGRNNNIGNMQQQGYAYIYERTTSALAADLQATRIPTNYQDQVQVEYDKQFSEYLKSEFNISDSSSKNKLSPSKYDKDLLVKDKDTVLTKQNVAQKIKDFNTCNQQEQREIGVVNALLLEYSRIPTVDFYEMAQEQMLAARARIRLLHERQAELIGHFLDGKSTKEAQQAFLEGVVPGIEELDPALFQRIAARISRPEEQTLEEFIELRNRYLAYIVQGLRTKTGYARLEEFEGLLGKKEIVLGSIGAEFGAGFQHDDQDTPKGQKQEDRDPIADELLLQSLGGNIPEFIRDRFGKMNRTPGSQKGKTGNLAVYLERYKMLFPMYFGNGKKGGVEMFTSPLFTAMHHETGHLVNYLKGTSGGKNKYTRPKQTKEEESKIIPQTEEGKLLENLTDEEEVYNISIDKYSDRAMSEELSLPERFAHKAYMGMVFGSDGWSEQEVHAMLTKWQKLSGQQPPLKNKMRNLQQEILHFLPGDKDFQQKHQEHLTEVTDWLDHLLSGEIPKENLQRIADAIAWCLDKLEHKVYDRLAGIQKGKLSITKPDNGEIINLGQDLDLVQVQHRRYIQAIVAAKLDLWVQGNADDRRAANQDWRALLSNKQGIRIEQSSQGNTIPKEFANEVQSNIAKLLSRQNGRKLVHTLMSAENALQIRTASTEQFEKLANVFESSGMLKEEAEKEAKNMLSGGQAGAINQSNSSVRVVGDHKLMRNIGSSSTMSIGTGMKDSHLMSMNQRGRLLFSPNFLELGHEMIHALQNLRGSNVGGLETEAYKGTAWENMSEHSVIEGTEIMRALLGDEFMTENMLREDHNLGVRHGHSSALTLKEAVARKLLEYANSTVWDKLGGIIFTGAPAGITNLRKLLAAKRVNWNQVRANSHQRTQRSDDSRSKKNVRERVTNFHEFIVQTCDTILNPKTTIDQLRQLLEDVENQVTKI
ncbi:MAG: M91 family zinc metallopeptidase [Bacteroidia bacterium]